MNFQIGRHNFFHVPVYKDGKFLGHTNHRWSEYSPTQTECEHQQCNCTKVVTERPEGEPASIQLSIDAVIEDDKRRFEASLGEDRMHYTFRWGEKVDQEFHNADGTLPKIFKEHAYFWLCNKGSGFKFEIPKAGYGYVDAVLCNIYLGNKVDISTLYHGHSPSKIVDLTKIDPRQIWAHEDCMTREAMAFMDMNSWESEEWWKLWGRSMEIIDKTAPIELAGRKTNTSVDKLRSVVESDALISTNLEAAYRFLSDILDNFDQTEAWKCISKVHQEGEKIHA